MSVLDARYRQNSSNPVTRAHHSAKNAAQLTRYCCYEITFAGFDGTAAIYVLASRNISAPSGRPCSPFGARMTRSSYRPVPRHSSATT
jgi:hypothetical protein